MRAHKAARRRRKRRLERLARLSRKSPERLLPALRVLVESWRREIWRRAGSLTSPKVWKLVSSIREDTNDQCGDMFAAEATTALEKVMRE